MNLGVLSVRNNRVVFCAMVLVVVGGAVAYQNMGRLEDPEFTIKEALIVTPYPGASAEEVAVEVTNPIEAACQQLGQLKRVESESVRGRSTVTVVIEDRFDKHSIPQVWDELRRKIADVQDRLPPSVRGRSIVVDDFGDVYGVFLAITGEGYTQAELRRYTEPLRRELLQAADVKKVDLFAAQQEAVFLEISRQRLSQLDIDERQIYERLQARNIAADGGRIRVGDEHTALDPKGAFASAEEMLDVVIGSDSSGRQLALRDVATIERSYQDPPRRILRYDGQPAIGLGISTVQGGNVVTMGDAVRERLVRMEADRPLGIEINEINFQSEAVVDATNDFIFNLIKAVSIVVIVLLIAMGLRTGIVVGMVLFLTIMATFLVMYLDGDILMERISLGALIIALCMLTDNAIIIVEGIRVRIEAGDDKLQVVKESVAQNQWPLFGATAIAVVAFAAIGLSDDSTGEYCNSLFLVILISLSLSWISAITVTPMLGYYFFNKKQTASGVADDPYGGIVFRVYRTMLVWSLRYRWGVVVASIVAFVVAVWAFGFVKQSFFPPATRPQFMVDVFLPSATHILATESFAESIEDHVHSLDGVTHISTFVGGGGLRFLLVYSPERENRAFVQFLVDVDDEGKIDGLIEEIQTHLEENYPGANAVAKKFLLGPGQGGRVQARFSGPDPTVLRRLAEQAETILEADGGAVCVRHDWRDRESVIRPTLLELQARRNGLTRVEVAQALELGFEGRVVGFYREPGDAAQGIFPQETRLLPIVARPPLNERSEADAIRSMQIWSPTAGRMIPLNQVMSGVAVEWEDPVVMRRDRFPTATVHADPSYGLPSQLFGRVREEIEAIELPPGYSLEWGGEYEDSRNARTALAESIPAALTLMVFIVICLFNSVRVTAVVWLVAPLALVAADAGYLVLIPLAGIAFLSVGRHPLAGLALGFAAVAGAFTVNMLIKPLDAVMVEFTNDAIALVDPERSIGLASNVWFSIASVIVLTVIIAFITERLIEPRLGKYVPEASPDDAPASTAPNVANVDGNRLSASESRGLLFAGLAALATLIVFALLAIPPGAPLRDAETDVLIGNSPFMNGLIAMIMVLFLGTGAAYGYGAGTLSSLTEIIGSIEKALRSLGPLLLLFLVLAQFIAYFNFSNMGTILALSLSDILQSADFPPLVLLIGFIVVVAVIDLLITGAIAKWALFAPIFVPLLLNLDVSPEATLAAYRVADSPMNSITPLNAYFALVVGFAQRYDRSAGVGTVVSLMLPYVAITFLAWTALFVIWHLTRLPWGV